MRCSASRTTCTADVRQTPAEGREAGRLFSTLLFEVTFKPIARPLGFFGDVAVDACARALARSSPLSDALARAIGRAGETPQ
jgi:hypothetical protein